MGGDARDGGGVRTLEIISVFQKKDLYPVLCVIYYLLFTCTVSVCTRQLYTGCTPVSFEKEIQLGNSFYFAFLKLSL